MTTITDNCHINRYSTEKTIVDLKGSHFDITKICAQHRHTLTLAIPYANRSLSLSLR